MDLTIDVEDYKLNIRAAGVIIHGNKILTHKRVDRDYYCLPGGRVAIGESSEETIKREIKEELGKEIQIKEYIATIENFFEKGEEKYHEIYFLYKIEFKEEEDKKINSTMKNMEGKEYLRYEWVEIEQLEKEKILPNCLSEILNAKRYPIHKINDQLKEKKKERKTKAEEYIGKIVNIKIDRPVGTKHPNWDMIYPINYGYVPNTISEDGEELDAYLVGVFEPLEEYEGKCIAIIHRTNDEDDKLVIAPKEKMYNKEQIKALTEFQEKYFNNIIIEDSKRNK